jgi:hypothetical protein
MKTTKTKPLAGVSAVAWAKNGRIGNYIYRRLSHRKAVELALFLNGQMRGSQLMAVVVPHDPKGGAK